MHKFLLGLFPLTSILFYVLLGVLIRLHAPPLYIYLPAGIRILSLYLIYGKSIQKLKEEKLLLWLPFLELIWLLLNPLILLSNVFRFKREW